MYKLGGGWQLGTAEAVSGLTVGPLVSLSEMGGVSLSSVPIVQIGPIFSATSMGGVAISAVSAPTVTINGLVSETTLGGATITQVGEVYYSDRIVVF